MQNPFQPLEPEYHRRWNAMQLTRRVGAEVVARDILGHLVRYQRVFDLTGVPVIVLAAIHHRESSGDFSGWLGNGDPWNRVSTHVPAGYGPFVSWEAGAVQALIIDGLDKVKNWSIEQALYREEAYNGFGPRNHGIATGYVWAGTDQYTRGKYVADGKWDAGYKDIQLGTACIMRTLLDMSPTLGDLIPSAPVATTLTEPPALVPVPLGYGGRGLGAWHDAFWIQSALNLLMTPHPPLVVDGSIGRLTRITVRFFQTANELEPDGLVGPVTMMALETGLKTAGYTIMPLPEIKK